MLALLLQAYEAHAKNKKTLIFNNGIFTSRNVADYFTKAGYPIRHLDNNTTPAEREEILKHKWIESEKAGYDIGFERALTDWIIKHRSKWRRSRQALHGHTVQPSN